MDSFSLGCKLSGYTRSFTFKVGEEDDAVRMQALPMLCLPEGAKDECNMVDVMARNHDRREIAVPAATLKFVLLTHARFGRLPPPTTCNLPPEVRFRPCVDHWHQIVTISSNASEEESEDQGREEEEAELCPALPAKKQGGRL